MAKIYKIHPAIGVARVGNSDEHFVGPEMPGIAARPADGNFKKDGKIKRQAARFYIYEYDDSNAGAQPVEVNADSSSVDRIEWTVHLANRKAAWYNFRGLTGEDGNYPPGDFRNPAIQPSDPADVESGPRKRLIIDPKPRKISGKGQTLEIAKGQSGDPGETWPAQFITGKKIESLGTLFTDEAGRLKVAGGYGISGTPGPGTPDIKWDNNDNWFDDVSDGSVSANIVFKDGSSQAVQSPAWVMVGVPDFAPTVGNVVNLYEVLYDLAIRNFDFNPAIFAAGQFKSGPSGYKPSYTKEIYPVLQRAINQKWVFDLREDPTDPTLPPGHTTFIDHQPLGTLLPGDPGRQARHAIFRRIGDPNNPRPFNPSIADKMPWLRGDEDEKTALTVTRTTYFLLTQWKDGHFIGDWTGVPTPSTAITPEGLDIAALENCAGGGFYPGMEAGWIMRNVNIYLKDAGPANLRIRHKTGGPQGVVPGDLTKRMALPWQADFNACNGNWWPAQRPQNVRVAGKPNYVSWSAREGTNDGLMRNIEMAENWCELGFVKGDPNGTLPLLEEERNWPRP